MKGRAGCGGAVAGALLRGGGVAGVGKSGAAGLSLGPGLAVGKEGGMLNPLEWKARCCGGQSRVHGVRCLGSVVGHGLRQLMQKEEGAGV